MHGRDGFDLPHLFGLPATVAFGELAQAGVLMSYGSRIVDDLRRLPYYIDRILDGATPSELPVEQETRFYLTVNPKTAKAIGITIPQSLLLRADEVIQ
jgi:putative ABC transport system substrate-binding protein